MARRRRSRFGRRRKPKPIKLPKIQFSETSKRYFTILFGMLFIGFVSLYAGMIVVDEIVPNASQQLYTTPTSLTMFLLSFLISMVAWQGIGILTVLIFVVINLLTFGLAKSSMSTTKQLPPSAWKMIPYSMVVCAIYGFAIGIANEEVKTLITTFDFAIAGGGWGVFLNFLARLRVLPIDENAVQNYDQDLK